jgi:DNA-binding CsgD family transcriptional regulator
MAKLTALISSLEKAPQSIDCLEQLAISRKVLGFDAVAFRNFACEPVYLHLAKWQDWASEFGWSRDFLKQFQSIQDLKFIELPKSHAFETRTLSWDFGKPPSSNQDLCFLQGRDSLIAQLRQQDLDQGLTVLVRRPYGQIGTINYLRSSQDVHSKMRPNDLAKLEKFARSFFQAMDISGAWQHFSTLTHRELECLGLAARGYQDKTIAHELHRSVDTVRFHMKSAMRKLSSKNRTEAVAVALTNNLIRISSASAPGKVGA